MAISTYAQLQAAVDTWLARTDMATPAPDLITLAEARLNRLIPAVETDVTLTGTADSRRIDVSANSVVAPIALFLVDPSNSDETQLTQKSDGSFEYLDASNRPRFWAMDSTSYIDFDCPLDQAYTFRFRIRQRYALSDSATTNWLLTYHPDVYLNAVLLWGGVYNRDGEHAMAMKMLLDEAIKEVCDIIAEQSRGVLTVDEGLQPRRLYDWSSDT